MDAVNFYFSVTVFKGYFFMIPGQNISHLEFLGPHVVILPIFLVWKKNSKTQKFIFDIETGYFGFFFQDDENRPNFDF